MGWRRVERVVRTQRLFAGLLRRVVGSTDAEGQGIDLPIDAVGAFISVEDARGLAGPDLSPFGAHPQTGVVAVSYVAGGFDWHSRSDVPGCEDITFGTGQVLVTHAGRGVVHEERTTATGLHHMTQMILRVPSDRRDTPASIAEHEVVSLGDGVVRIFDARTLGSANVDAAAYHCTLSAAVPLSLTLDASHTTGFVYARSGSLLVREQRVDAGSVAILGAEGGELQLTAVEEGPCDCLVGTAAP